MGWSTHLIFNEVTIPKENLRAFRDAAIEASRDEKSDVFYEVQYLYIERRPWCIIELEVSKKHRAELKKLFGENPATLDSLGDEILRDEDDESTPYDYLLDWYPFDGYYGKWSGAEGLAAWLSEFCSSGAIYQMLVEQDGGLWGWELGGGRYRHVTLKPVGRWKKPRPR